MRQQLGTAKGVVFVTMEDETGIVNVIVWRAIRDRYRNALLSSRLLAVYGTWQRQEDVTHPNSQSARGRVHAFRGAPDGKPRLQVKKPLQDWRGQARISVPLKRFFPRPGEGFAARVLRAMFDLVGCDSGQVSRWLAEVSGERDRCAVAQVPIAIASG